MLDGGEWRSSITLNLEENVTLPSRDNSTINSVSLQEAFRFGMTLESQEQHAEARRWMREVAIRGDLRAARYYALMCLGATLGGGGGDEELMEARWWFKALGRVGHARSAFNYAGMCVDGRGGDRNIDEAIKWFQIAFEGGRTQAAMELGTIFQSANNIVEAVKWYRRAVGCGIEGAALNTIFEVRIVREREIST